MTIVVGLGGNALAGLRDAEPPGGTTPVDHIAEAAAALQAVRRRGPLVVTHGNGPQVGLLAEQRPSVGLDVLDASSEGELGYLLERALRNSAPGEAADAVEVLAVLTQVLVDPHDPAFSRPTKPIGPLYDEGEAHRLAQRHGWQVAAQPDGRWRRVVASPDPQRIVEVAALARLVRSGVTVICAGGGGIPVALDEHGALHGVSAVIDKDLTTAQLAIDLDAEALLLLTDVAGIHDDLLAGSAVRRTLRHADAAFVRALGLPVGSMGAKVEAAARFVEATGRVAAIGALADAEAILDGTAGSRVVAEGAEPRWWLHGQPQRPSQGSSASASVG